jgi:glycopeptide antibiotics resistance protein
LSIVVLAAYLVLILALTLVLFRTPTHRPETNLRPFYAIVRDCRAGGRDFAVNIAGNVAAFIPLGFLLPLAWRRPVRAWQVALLAAVLSAAIEAAQYASARGVADVDDVLLNTLGGLLGYAAFRAWRRHRPGRRT